jgi:hypothetical protein
VLVIAVAMTAGCDVGVTSSTAGQDATTGTSASSGQTSSPGTPDNSAATNDMVRLGCGEYCLQAAGYGGGGGTPNMTRIWTTQVTALPDGTVAITVECLFQQDCLGRLFLDSGDSTTDSVCLTPAVAGRVSVLWGQSDLEVPAQTTLTFGVTLSPCAFDLLSQSGTLQVAVTADSSLTVAALSPADRQGLDPIDRELITVSAP